MKKIIFNLFALTCIVNLSYSQTVIATFDFNSASSYPISASSTAANISCSSVCTESFTTFSGTTSGVLAFASVATSGNAIAMNNSSGTNTKNWEIHINGSALINYKSYFLYLQAQRSSTGAQTITIAHSTDGSTYTDFPTTITPGNGSYSESVIDLSSLTQLDFHNDVYIRLKASGATGTGTLRIDNLQFRATEVITITGPQGPQGPVGADGATNAWSKTGTNGTNPSVNFIGTIDSVDFVTKVNNVEAMRIKVDGKIGIGTSSPSQKLEIVHSDTAGGLVLNQTNTTLSKSEIKYKVNGVQKWAIGNSLNLGSASSFFIWNSDPSIFRSSLFINGSNNYIGIDKMNPSKKLDVNGDINATGFYKNGVIFKESQWQNVAFGISNSGKVGIGGDPEEENCIPGNNEALTVHGIAKMLSATGDTSVDGRCLLVGHDGGSGFIDVHDEHGNSGGIKLNYYSGKDVTIGYSTAPGATGNLFVSGKILIGSGTPEAKLDVHGNSIFRVTDGTPVIVVKNGSDVIYRLNNDGKIEALDIRVRTSIMPDYVFEKGYKRMSLYELETYINKNKHLPGVPSAKEFEKEGLSVADMNKILLEKIEEQSLYQIEQQKQIDDLKKELGLLKENLKNR